MGPGFRRDDDDKVDDGNGRRPPPRQRPVMSRAAPGMRTVSVASISSSQIWHASRDVRVTCACEVEQVFLVFGGRRELGKILRRRRRRGRSSRPSAPRTCPRAAVPPPARHRVRRSPTGASTSSREHARSVEEADRRHAARSARYSLSRTCNAGDRLVMREEIGDLHHRPSFSFGPEADRRDVSRRDERRQKPALVAGMIDAGIAAGRQWIAAGSEPDREFLLERLAHRRLLGRLIAFAATAGKIPQAGALGTAGRLWSRR